MIKLGSRVKDTITGFEGVAIGRTIWLYGCERICVEPTTLREGKPIEERWFDDQRVELLEEGTPRVSRESVSTSGGPQRDPSR